MSKSLLPIIFARGQNESVDPRVAPPDVHASASNVRWRKDGRPEKKYGVAAVTTTGLTADGFSLQPVNAITSWNDTPVIAVGSGVRLLSALGWNPQFDRDYGEISHFGPGVREPVIRDEVSSVNRVTSGTAGGLVVHVWDDGTAVYYSVKDAAGRTVVAPQSTSLLGTSPRCVSTTNFVYILSKQGTTLNLVTFDPATLALSYPASPGTLHASTSHFDACGRGGDFLITYQSVSNIVTIKLLTAVALPAVMQTQTVFADAAGSYVGVAGSSTSNIFVAVTNVTTGNIGYAVFNNAHTALLGGTVLNTDLNNTGQPGIVLESNTVAQIVWGGFVAASASSYMRAVRLNAGGPLSPVSTFYGVSPASKPFMGPAYSALSAEIDGGYVWVATHNADNNSTKWDTQRAYYLVKYHTINNTYPLRRQMHVPNAVPGQFGQLHLSDVLNLGAGEYLTPLLNAIRFGNAQNPTFGFDTVSARSIFGSAAMAARDTSTAGRVLQFSGGSLFELNGTAEETGFSNFPVIQSVTGGGGGALTPGNYIYRAVYEWLDLQGRRHRSAPSDPFTFAAGASTSATLVMKPLVADAHVMSPSGTIAGRGVTLHVYRTLVGQSTFHRVTPNVGAPSGSVVGAATVSFLDLMSDATAAGQEFIYTDGGVADNTLCPPHTFHTVCSGRLWVGGQLDRCVLTSSKILVEGEPTQFSDLEAFSVFLPQECTGLASIDGTVVAFSRERIYFVTGDGPNDQGIGSFNPPVELPTDVGCVDWRSVVETSVGVFFLSKRGIFLLPRGFNTPVFVGAEVESKLALYPYIVSSTLVTIPSGGIERLGETTVRFVVGDEPSTPFLTAVLVHDLRTGGWSVDDEGERVMLSGTWSGSFVTSRSPSGPLLLHAENATAGYASGSNRFIVTSLGTGDIRPFGVAGYGQFDSVVLVGEFRGPCFVTVFVNVDGVGYPYTFDVQGPDLPDGSVYFDVTPKDSKGTAVRITCNDSGNPGASSVSEGVIMQGLFIEHSLIGGTKRLAAARRA